MKSIILASSLLAVTQAITTRYGRPYPDASDLTKPMDSFLTSFGYGNGKYFGNSFPDFHEFAILNSDANLASVSSNCAIKNVACYLLTVRRCLVLYDTTSLPGDCPGIRSAALNGNIVNMLNTHLENVRNQISAPGVIRRAQAYSTTLAESFMIDAYYYRFVFFFVNFGSGTYKNFMDRRRGINGWALDPYFVPPTLQQRSYTSLPLRLSASFLTAAVQNGRTRVGLAKRQATSPYASVPTSDLVAMCDVNRLTTSRDTTAGCLAGVVARCQRHNGATRGTCKEFYDQVLKGSIYDAAYTACSPWESNASNCANHANSCWNTGDVQCIMATFFRDTLFSSGAREAYYIL